MEGTLSTRQQHSIHTVFFIARLLTAEWVTALLYSNQWCCLLCNAQCSDKNNLHGSRCFNRKNYNRIATTRIYFGFNKSGRLLFEDIRYNYKPVSWWGVSLDMRVPQLQVKCWQKKGWIPLWQALHVLLMS